MYLFVLFVACLTLFVNCLVKQFAMCLGVVDVLLLNVMDVFSVGGGALWSSTECAYCSCDLSKHLSVPSISLFVFCMSEVISSFKSWRAGSQVFALLMLFILVIVHTMWLGKSLQLLCILPFGMLYLSAISMMFVKIMLAVCMLVGMVV